MVWYSRDLLSLKKREQHTFFATFSRTIRAIRVRDSYFFCDENSTINIILISERTEGREVVRMNIDDDDDVLQVQHQQWEKKLLAAVISHHNIIRLFATTSVSKAEH